MGRKKNNSHEPCFAGSTVRNEGGAQLMRAAAQSARGCRDSAVASDHRRSPAELEKLDEE
jgi:hypothetical protein